MPEKKKREGEEGGKITTIKQIRRGGTLCRRGKQPTERGKKKHLNNTISVKERLITADYIHLNELYWVWAAGKRLPPH